MTRSKWLVSFVIASPFVVGYGLFYLAHHTERPSPAQLEAAQAAVRPASPEVQQFRGETPVKRVEQLYNAESERVGKIDPDPKATQERLKALSAELTPEEYAWLKERALNRKEPADARFFSTYLTGLSPQSAALPALREIAVTPLPKLKSESQLDIEKQIRALATEGISRMCKNGAAREALLDVEHTHEDEFLKDRAHRALYAFHTCTDIEASDRAAMEKVYTQGQ